MKLNSKTITLERLNLLSSGEEFPLDDPQHLDELRKDQRLMA